MSFTISYICSMLFDWMATTALKTLKFIYVYSKHLLIGMLFLYSKIKCLSNT